MSTIVMILAFLALVVIHERGHMTAAKKVGVKVTEFGIGIPPKIIKLRKDRSGTTYTLNLIPLGGFVRLFGDNPNKQESYTTPGSYHHANRIQKIIILIAGIVMNIFTARAIFTTLFIIGTKPLNILPDTINSHSYLMPSESFAQENGFFTTNTKTQAIIKETKKGSRASTQNIEPESVITHINTTAIYGHNLTQIIQKECKKGCTITRQPPTKSPPQKASFQCTDTCLLGVMIDTANIFGIKKIQFPRRKAPIKAGEEIRHQTRLTFDSLGNLVSTLRSGDTASKQKASAQLSGPVGIVRIGGSIFEQGERSKLWMLIGMISLALGLFNLLPIPALDGGRIIGVLIQVITHITSHKYYRFEAIINTIIMLALMIFGVIIMFKDATQFYCRNNIISRTIFGNNIECIEKQK